MRENGPIEALSTRRSFCCSAAAVALAVALPRKLLGEQDEAQSAGGLADDPMRPQFHLLPARNWMNDPNGPIYFKGSTTCSSSTTRHAAVWGNMSWNHAVSDDMMHWRHLPLAMTPTPEGQTRMDVFRGRRLPWAIACTSSTQVRKSAAPALATIRGGSDNYQESQCLAWADDPQLVHWTKDPAAGGAAAARRDEDHGLPRSFGMEAGRVVLHDSGSGVAKVGGCVLLYGGKDLKNWEYLHKLTSGAWNGKRTPNPCDDGEMWECPEFFALDGGHVLIYSTLGKVFWESGVLDESTMKFTAKKKGELDLDAFYAPKTQLDAHGRRILWGWIQERRDEAAMGARDGAE